MEEGREVEETTDEGEEGQTSVQAQSLTNIDRHGQYMPNGRDSPRTPPEPPPVPTPSPPPPLPVPNHPEQPDDNNDLKSNKTATQRCADAMHNPGGEMVSPGSLPPSVWLKGERNKVMSLYVKADNVGTVDYNHDTQQLPRKPMGMPDGDERRPNKPTEPPDEEEGGETAS
ncbi:hypothetical protein PAXINDRAFT_11798 [Paxillus involutus ATCC 200175]|uniref:Unplaced genomic scaffold PAXINscaffold_15, whole genome shotgun sequence n=1 Tax=Paxillus involutus ATCC 200175 TaxID=664439 RepID=A0A0C9U855_PAXIN|nr:hypothetical protein PAXINDRAFT_11798 [Paxillus involutus ATCC 200175]